MPISKYDPEFGGEGGAEKAYDAMRDEYGDKKGERVFYGTMNRNKKRAGKRTKITRARSR